MGSVPGYAPVAERLKRARIRFNPALQDRATVSVTGTLTLGPEPFAGSGNAALVSLAGTLAHEAFHLTQRGLLKSVSFWAGVATRTPVMARYEKPAYDAQARFLDALAAARPDLSQDARREKQAALTSCAACYGVP